MKSHDPDGGTTTLALVYSSYGDETRLEWKTDRVRAPGNRELLIRVSAASINPMDWKILEGRQKIFTGFRLSSPRVFGADFCGTVLETGKGTGSFNPGDRVMGMLDPLTRGSFSQRLIVPSSLCVKVPESFTDFEAGAYGTIALTTISALRLKLRKAGYFSEKDRSFWSGAKVLLNGASGGVGTMLLLLLIRLGARVTAVASPPRFERLRELGAAECFDYSEGLSTLQGRFDVVIDSHGSLAASDPGKLLRKSGSRLFIPLSIENRHVPWVIISGMWRRIFRKIRTRIVLAVPSATAYRVASALAEAGLKPIVGKIFPSMEVQKAVSESRNGHALGKTVVDFSDQAGATVDSGKSPLSADTAHDQISLVRARARNLDACLEILSDSILGEYFPGPVARQILRDECRAGNLFAATDRAGEVLGFFSRDNSGSFLTFPYLHLLCVRTALRGKGIGARLLKHFEKLALEEPGYPERVKAFLLVAKDNAEAQRFYHANGYSTLGIIEDMFAPGDTELLLIKDLGLKSWAQKN